MCNIRIGSLTVSPCGGATELIFSKNVWKTSSFKLLFIEVAGGEGREQPRGLLGIVLGSPLHCLRRQELVDLRGRHRVPRWEPTLGTAE